MIPASRWPLASRPVGVRPSPDGALRNRQRECPVLQDLPSSRRAELVAGEPPFLDTGIITRTRILKAILRVERAVAYELINTSVKRVGAGLRDRIDHPARGIAVFRRVVLVNTENS